MKKFAALLLLSCSFSALAVGIGNDNPPSLSSSSNTNLNANSISNRIDNDVRSSAAAFVASANVNDNRNANANNSSAYAAGGTSLAQSGGSSSGVNFAVNYPAQVAALGLGSLYPSAPCMGTSQLGGGNPFFNIGVGSSWESTECNIRETARSFSGMGKMEDALAVLCASPYAAVAPSCIARQPVVAEAK